MAPQSVADNVRCQRNDAPFEMEKSTAFTKYFQPLSELRAIQSLFLSLDQRSATSNRLLFCFGATYTDVAPSRYRLRKIILE